MTTVKVLVQKKTGRKFVDAQTVDVPLFEGKAPCGCTGQAVCGCRAIQACINAGEKHGDCLSYVCKLKSGSIDVGFVDEFEGRTHILYKLKPLTNAKGL